MSIEGINRTMLIGELAHASGFSKDTLRYYEKLGIIRGVGRRGNSYREYGYETLRILEVVHVGKDLGFTLPQIKYFINDVFYNDPDNEKLKEILKEKLTEIDRQIGELHKLKERVQMMVESGPYRVL